MRYARIANYNMVTGTFPELTDMAERGVLPLFAKQPGFVDYGLIDVGANKVISISIWESREVAYEAGNVAAAWIKDNIADRLHLVDSHVGELALFHGAPVAA
jgi:heme-degrading monooxygenase HmoA